LNGSEMVAGDTIIIPIDISTLATTMSMIRNGMKIVKPIWKPVFSSLVTNAGTSSDSGTSSGPCIGAAFEIFANSARSDSRVCFSMKVLNGATPRCIASSIDSAPVENGL
jgi:hypothetical protein